MKNRIKRVRNAFNDYLKSKPDRMYDLEIKEYDLTTNQLFLIEEGAFTREDRLDLQRYIQESEKGVLVNTMAEYEEGVLVNMMEEYEEGEEYGF